MNLLLLVVLGFMKGLRTRSLRRLKRATSATALMAAMPTAFAMDVGTWLEKLVAIHPLPLFVVLQPSGVIDVQLDVQRMANEMPARIEKAKKADADALWFDVLLMVESPVSATKANVVFEFKTRCAVAAADAYEQQRDSHNAMLSSMSALVRVARDRRLNPKWAAICLPADESVAASYRQVMQFPANGMQVMSTDRLIYLTNINSSLMFAF